jgi:hypothetical protein
MKIKINLELRKSHHPAAPLEKVISEEIVEIPDQECKETRPDWGEYLPLVTFPAIERALKKRGFLHYLSNPKESWTYCLAE